MAKLSGIVTKSISGPTLAVCGCVNTKESSGVYIGDLAFDRFLLNNEGASFQVLSIHDPLHIPTQRTCGDWGLSSSKPTDRYVSPLCSCPSVNVSGLVRHAGSNELAGADECKGGGPATTLETEPLVLDAVEPNKLTWV
jgi:hypothetical protein